MTPRNQLALNWAERAMSPMRGFEPLEVRGQLGLVHGFVMCIGNFDAVEAKRMLDYAKTSAGRRSDAPIWC